MDIVLLALLEQRLPTDSLVAEEYGLNITLEKIQYYSVLKTANGSTAKRSLSGVSGGASLSALVLRSVHHSQPAAPRG